MMMMASSSSLSSSAAAAAFRSSSPAPLATRRRRRRDDDDSRKRDRRRQPAVSSSSSPPPPTPTATGGLLRDEHRASSSSPFLLLGPLPHPQTPPSPMSPPHSSRRSFFSMVAIAAASTAVVPPSLPIAPSLPTTRQQPPLPFTSPLRQLAASTFVANAAETVGKDEECNDASCLGVWDGLLADCPHPFFGGRGNKLAGGGAGCVSSQDDTPGIFAEPWDYSETMPLVPSSSSSSASSSGGEDKFYEDQMDRLILALQTTSRQRGDSADVASREGRYLRAIVTDGISGERSVAEFYFTPDDTTVQFRLGSISSVTSSSSGAARALTGGYYGSLSNSERSERIRKALRYLKVPVLRNRRRTFLFVESDGLDGFGPGSASLGPPEEMRPGEIEINDGQTTSTTTARLGFDATGGGRGGGERTARGSDDADPKLRIDWVESFPTGGPR